MCTPSAAAPLRPTTNSAVKFAHSYTNTRLRRSPRILSISTLSHCSCRSRVNPALFRWVACNSASSAAMRSAICCIWLSTIIAGCPSGLAILQTAPPLRRQSPKAQNRSETTVTFAASTAHVLLSTAHSLWAFDMYQQTLQTLQDRGTLRRPEQDYTAQSRKRPRSTTGTTHISGSSHTTLLYN